MLVKRKRLLVFLMIFFIFINNFLAPVVGVTGSVVSAEEESEEEDDEGGKYQNILGKDVNSGEHSFFQDVKKNLEYDEDMHLEITKAILNNGKGIEYPEYAEMYTDGVEKSGKFLGNGKLEELYGPFGDDEASSSAINSVGLLRMPVYLEDGKETVRIRDVVDLGEVTKINYKLTGSQEVQELGNGIMDISLFGHNEHFIQAKIVKAMIKVSTMADTGSAKVLGEHFRSNKKAYERKQDHEVGFDNYGNAVTQDYDVLVPYWMNAAVPHFKDKNGKKQDNLGLFGASTMISHPGLSDPDLGDRRMFFAGDWDDMVKKSREYRAQNSGKHNNISKKIPFKSVFDVNKKGMKKKVLQDIYRKDSEYIDDLAEYIVGRTKSRVKAYNKELLNNIEEAIEKGEDIEGYLANSTGDRSVGSSTVEEEFDRIAEADGLIRTINEIFRVGIFKLIQLTISAGVVNFYSSQAINYSMGDIFNTVLLSDSALWKTIVNTVLIMTVAFSAVYLMLLLVRMFMGYLKIKDIVVRFILLALAVAMPMVGYSPVVDFIFNKPSEQILNKEMSKMFVLDMGLSLREELAEEWKEEMPDFFSDYNLRERSEEYIIPFYTSEHIEGYDMNTQEGIVAAGGLYGNDLVVVNVSAFHVFEWLSELEEDKDVGTLFEFLETKYLLEYMGIGDYEEYAYDTSIELLDSKKRGKKITSSDLLRKVYEEVLENVSDVSTTMYDIMNDMYYDSESEMSVREMQNIIFDLTSTAQQREKIYGVINKSDGNRSTETLDYLDSIGVNVGDSDLLGIRDVVNDLHSYRLYAEETDTQVQNINEDMFNLYLGTYMDLRKNMKYDADLIEAELNVLILNIFFNINKEIGIELFPKELSNKSITLDTYVRALYIPLEELTPTNVGVENVSSYVAAKDNLLATLMFLLAVVSLFIYGAIKYVVLFVILMPLILIMTFYNYVILSDLKSKVWVGALGILLSFAVVNGGLLVLWKFLIYMLNAPVDAGLSGNTYPAIFVHSLLVVLYLILALKYVLKPLFDTVKGNFSSLGGDKMADGTMKVFGQVKSSMTSFWNGLSRGVGGPDGRASGNIPGGGISGDVEKDIEERDNKAGKMNPDAIDSKKTDEEKESDSKDVETITSKLADKGKGALKKTRAGRAVSTAKAGAALVGVAGLAGVASLMKNSPDDKRGIIERLQSARDASGKRWLEGSDTLDSEVTDGKVMSASEIVKTAEEMDAIPDKLEEEHLTEDDMEVLEEMGLDVEVKDTKSFEGDSPMVMNVENDDQRRMIEENLKEKGYKFDTNGNKIVLGMDKGEFDDKIVRKDMLGGLVTKSESKIKELRSKSLSEESSGIGLKATKLDEKSYSFGKDKNLLPFVEDQVEKMKKEGKDVSLSTGSDGGMQLDFGNIKDASSVISTIEKGSSSYAKAKGYGLGTTLDVGEGYISSLVSKLKENNIRYDAKVDKNGISSFEIDKDQSRLAEKLIAESEFLSSNVSVLSGENRTIEEDEVARLLVEEQVSKGKLNIGEDVMVNGDTVHAISNEGKRYFNEMSGDYAKRKEKLVDDLVDLSYGSAKTVVGGKGGIDVYRHLDGSDKNMDAFVSDSAIHEETYEVNNRKFDLDELHKEVTRIRKKEQSSKGSLSKVEKDLRDSFTKVESRGIEFNRVGDTRLEVNSGYAGQQDLVSDLLKDFNTAVDERNKQKKARGPRGARGPSGGGRPGGVDRTGGSGGRPLGNSPEG